MSIDQRESDAITKQLVDQFGNDCCMVAVMISFYSSVPVPEDAVSMRHTLGVVTGAFLRIQGIPIERFNECMQAVARAQVTLRMLNSIPD